MARWPGDVKAVLRWQVSLMQIRTSLNPKGSDYGHNDLSKEPELVATMRAREDVPGRIIEKILCENPRRFYAL